MTLQEWSTSKEDLLNAALREFVRRTRFPLAFGGFVHDGSVRVTTVLGNRTRALDGLIVRPDRGLGGRAMTERRPRMTADYGSSRQITHDYDTHVLGEGISALLAVPLIVDDRVRGVMYGGDWRDGGVGDAIAAPGFSIAQSLAQELRVRDEVERRVSAFGARVAAPSPGGLDTATREELRGSYAELRSISATVSDDVLRARLTALEARLAGLAGAAPATSTAGEAKLSRRELDVLSCAALGATNGEIATRLGLKEATVKSYLQAAMSKLEASTRHAAVAKARRVGILP